MDTLTLDKNVAASAAEAPVTDAAQSTPPPLPQPPPAAAEVPPAAPATDIRPDELLISILKTKRSHGSQGDLNFRLWLHAEIGKLKLKIDVAKEGSTIVQVGKKSTTMFSCHIDTVHGPSECNGSKQDLAYDPAFGHIFLATPLEGAAKPSCLGGDDGVGIYLMLKMMAAKVRGTYVFHVGEERSGIGSRAILATRKEWLATFDRCIAFDRAVQYGEPPEVIITQGGEACASTSFGTALADALSEHEFDNSWVISHKGSFTDSKVYAGVIPECVNLGCFYAKQHSSSEVVDSVGVEQLLGACLKLKWDDLKVSRALPPERPALKSHMPQNDFGFEDDFRHSYKNSDYIRPSMPQTKPGKSMPPFSEPLRTLARSDFDLALDYTKDEIMEMVEGDPTIAIDIMCLLIARYKGLKAENEALSEFLGA